MTEKQLRLLWRFIQGLTIFGYVAFGFLLGVLHCAWKLREVL